MNTNVSTIIDTLYLNTTSSSMQSAWLRIRIENLARMLTRHLDDLPEEVSQSVMRRIASAAKLDNPLEELPDTIEDFHDISEMLKSKIFYAVSVIVKNPLIETDTRISRMGSREPYPEWDRITEYAYELYRTIDAIVDFTDEGDPCSLPIKAYDAYSELHDIEYLCHVLFILVGGK